MMAQKTQLKLFVLTLSILSMPKLTAAQISSPSSKYYRPDLAEVKRPGTDFSSSLITNQTSFTSSDPIRVGIFGGDDVDMAIFSNFGDNILNSFTGTNLYYQLAAVAATPVLVNNNVDYHVERFFNQHPAYGNFASPVPITGQILPFIAGGSLLAYAGLRNDKEVLGASYAVIQASIIELLDNTTLKAFTGRPSPNWRRVSNMEDLSEEFRFGFLRGGVYNGWPSGHTGATMAVVSALTNYYPDETWLKVAGYSLVAYTMYGVTSVHQGGMHWFSDAVAGALMGYAIGSTVGKYYRNLYSSLTGGPVSQESSSLSLGITPEGLGVSYTF